MKKLIPFILLVSPFGAHAAGTTANVSWTAPTEFTDGRPIPSGTLTGYLLEAKPKSFTGAAVTKQVAGTVLTTTFPGLVCGNFDITVKALTANSASDPAGPAVYATGIQCSDKPNPPGALTAS